ncbi:putative toxin-antitoxin system toxin component, PIN family [Candidatus Roizmanbacteria bacterium]|nr:putative toxin-antitoxin system toxin component, PIN family [Candidatus Roizmanbacteria bacterium]
MKEKNSTKSKVVLDTNVFIAALITDGVCRTILKEWAKERISLFCTTRVVEEIGMVGKRTIFRKYFSENDLRKLLWHIKQKATFVKDAEKIPKKYFPTDINDLLFVSCIIAAKADYFVTGNTKHFKKRISKTEVITPKEFLALLR